MEALLDNDFLFKLARIDLLSAFDTLLQQRGYQRPYGRLASAPFVLKVHVRPPPPTFWSSHRQQAALRTFLLSGCRSLPAPPAAITAQLNVPHLDPGEIVLFAYALANPATRVFTGDKRAITALALHPRLTSEAARLAGRVVHLEMAIDDLVVSIGSSGLRRNISARPGIDGTLANVCGKTTTDADLRRALQRSVGALRAQTGTLLATSW